MTTYKDLIDMLVDYVGGANSPEAERKARRSVQNAYSEMITNHNWMYFFTRGRILTSAQQTTGTITYTEATRTVVLAGSTWPSWTKFGYIILNQLTYKIASVTNSTTLILDPSTIVGGNLAAGTTYTLYRDVYQMPSDFRCADEVVNLNNTAPLQYCHPRDWLNFQRIRRGPATPKIYTFTGDQKYFGGMAIRFFPAPDLSYDFDFLYQRIARPLSIVEYKTGTVTATDGSPAVTGSGSTWTPDMIGSTIRFSENSQDTPTGRSGYSPFIFEDIILDVPTATSITLTSDATATLAGVKYSISDPADIEDASMSVFLARECEKQMRLQMRMKTTMEEMKAYEEAKFTAWECDARSTAKRAAGTGNYIAGRLADMPLGADVS